MPFEAGDYTDRLPKESSFRVTFYQTRPESRGRLRILSADPRTPPSVAPNYVATRKDLQTAVDGLRLMGRICSAAPLRTMSPTEMLPDLANETDDALVDYIRATADTGYHHVGTCRMGRADDANAVVDSQLRVRGVGRLRVADGSVMPAIISGNTNAACIMIGEKCSDMVGKEG